MSLVENGGLSGSDALSIMNSRNGGGFGYGFDGSFWIIILFLFALMGGNGFGGFGGGNAAPYVVNAAAGDVQRGFDQSAVMNGITGISTAVANGFANAEISRCNSQANILQTLNNNQAASLASMNSLAMSLQNCCCENRAAVADLKYSIANEAAATRAASAANTQAILDKLCQQEIDALKEANANLRTQLNLASLRESQTAQTAQILADNSAQTVALEQYLHPVPVPAYTVQNPNCCAPNYGCGCGN